MRQRGGKGEAEVAVAAGKLIPGVLGILHISINREQAHVKLICGGLHTYTLEGSQHKLNRGNTISTDILHEEKS